MDDIRIWNRTLTDEEIQTAYTNKTYANTSGLAAEYTFDDGSLTSNGYTLTTGSQTVIVQLPQQVDLDEDTPATVNIQTTDIDNDPLTLILVSEPASGQLFQDSTMLGTDSQVDLGANGAVALRYVPNSNANGDDVFTYKLVDALGLESETVYSVSLNITAVNDAPEYTIGDQVMDEDVTYNRTVGISDVESAPSDLAYEVSVSNGALFDSVTINTVTAASFNIQWVPALNQFGTSSVLVTVTDNLDVPVHVVTRSFTITVNALNDAPIVTISPQVATEDVTHDVVVIVSDVESSIADLEYGVSVSDETLFDLAQSRFVTANASDAVTLNLVPSLNANGTTRVTITVTDNASMPVQVVTQSFTITVNSVNDLPVFTNTASPTGSNRALYAYTPTVYDVEDSVGSLIITADELPAWLTFNGGVVSGTPSNNEVGTHSMVLRVTDRDSSYTEQALVITIADVDSDGDGYFNLKDAYPDDATRYLQESQIATDNAAVSIDISTLNPSTRQVLGSDGATNDVTFTIAGGSPSTTVNVGQLEVKQRGTLIINNVSVDTERIILRQDTQLTVSGGGTNTIDTIEAGSGTSVTIRNSGTTVRSETSNADIRVEDNAAVDVVNQQGDVNAENSRVTVTTMTGNLNAVSGTTVSVNETLIGDLILNSEASPTADKTTAIAKNINGDAQVSNGSSVTVNETLTGSLTIDKPGSHATLKNVIGSIQASDSAAVIAETVAGAGISAQNNAQVTVSNSISGPVNADNATITAGSIDGFVTANSRSELTVNSGINGDVYVAGRSTLRSVQNVSGDVVITGGSLLDIGNSPGYLNSAGSVTVVTSSILFELGGTNPYTDDCGDKGSVNYEKCHDVLIATTVTLNQATLIVRLWPTNNYAENIDFQPTVNNDFRLVSSNQINVVNPLTFILPTLDVRLRWVTDNFVISGNIYVTANAQPSINPVSENTHEDHAVTINIEVQDAEAKPMALRVVSTPNYGVLTINGVNAQSGSTINLTQQVTQSVALIYTPDDDYFGPDTIVLTVQDDLRYESERVTINITVESVNDKPVFSIVTENQILHDWAGSTVTYNLISTFNLGAQEPTDDVLSYTITPSDPAVFAQNPQIVTSNGELSYALRSTADTTVVTLSIRLIDTGGTDRNGVPTSDPVIVTLNIQAVPDSPTADMGGENPLQYVGDGLRTWLDASDGATLYDENGKVLSLYNRGANSAEGLVSDNITEQIDGSGIRIPTNNSIIVSSNVTNVSHIFLVYKDALKLKDQIDRPSNSASRTLVEKINGGGSFQIIGDYAGGDGTLYELIVVKDEVTGNNRLAILWYLVNKWGLEDQTVTGNNNERITISKDNKRIYDRVDVGSGIGGDGADQFNLDQLGPASTWVKDNGVLSVPAGACAPGSSNDPVVMSGTMRLEIIGSGQFTVSDNCP